MLVISAMPIIDSGTSGAPSPSTPAAPFHDPCGVTTAAVTPRIPAGAATAAMRWTAACRAWARGAGRAEVDGGGHGKASDADA